VEAVATLIDAGAAVNQATVSVDGGAMGMFAGVKFELYCGGGRGECAALLVGLHVISDVCVFVRGRYDAWRCRRLE
jgi:hypothetical protein